MKTKTFLSIVASVSLFISMNAQEMKLIKSKKPDDNQVTAIHKVIINHEMIERFNNCEADGEYLSWRDLILGFDYKTMSELYLAYKNADLNGESLADIKLVLEEKQQEHLNNSNISTSDLAWFNKVKQEINNKLRMNEMVARK